MGKSNARKGLHKTGSGLGYREKERIPDRIQMNLRVQTLRANLRRGVRVKGTRQGQPFRGVVDFQSADGRGVCLKLDTPLTLPGGEERRLVWVSLTQSAMGDDGVARYCEDLLALKVLG